MCPPVNGQGSASERRSAGNASPVFANWPVYPGDAETRTSPGERSATSARLLNPKGFFRPLSPLQVWVRQGSRRGWRHRGFQRAAPSLGWGCSGERPFPAPGSYWGVRPSLSCETEAGNRSALSPSGLSAALRFPKAPLSASLGSARLTGPVLSWLRGRSWVRCACSRSPAASVALGGGSQPLLDLLPFLVPELGAEEPPARAGSPLGAP